MRTIFIITFFIVFLAFGNDIGYTSTLPIWKHFTYVFQHGSVLHLIINSFSFYMLFGMLQRFIRPSVIIAIGYTSAVVMSFFASYGVPVVGASGMIYAMLGIYLYLIKTKRIIFKDKFVLNTLLISIALFLIISLIKTNQAGLLHLLCLVSGLTISYVTLR